MGMFALSVRITRKTCVFLVIADTETYEKFHPLEDRQRSVVRTVDLGYFFLIIFIDCFASLLIFFHIFSQEEQGTQNSII